MMHIAIITFGYEPLAHVSTKRPGYMARELARGGDEVSVLTVDWRPLSGKPRSVATCVDEALANDRLHEVRLDPRVRNPRFDPSVRPRSTEPPGHKFALARRAQTILRTLSSGPFPSWVADALDALVLLHSKRPVDVVWAIRGDDSAHEIAHRFKRREGVPWVADFKDPWDLFHTGLSRIPQSIATRRRLRTASALSETSAAQADNDSRAFNLPAHVIWSGYDSSLMQHAESTAPSAQVSISYFGHLSIQHDIDRIGRLFRRVEQLSADAHSKVSLHVWAHQTAPLEEALARHNQMGRLVKHKFVPEAEVFGLMKGSSALLLLPATHFVPSGGSVGVKELEYFASGTPVLVLGRVLEELRPLVDTLPQVVQATGDEDAAQFVVRLADNTAAVKRGNENSPEIAKYGWNAQAAKLREVLRHAHQGNRNV